jgi:hypothetical protein
MIQQVARSLAISLPQPRPRDFAAICFSEVADKTIAPRTFLSPSLNNAYNNTRQKHSR